MTTADILIITAGPLCRNPRPAKEARTLAAAGHAVTVLAAGGAERFEEEDRGFMAETGIRKITTGGPAARGAAWHSNRLATWLARRAVRAGFDHPQALGPYFAYRRALRGLQPHLAIVHTEIGLAIGRHLQRRGTLVAADLEDWHSRDLLPEARRHRPIQLLQRLEQHHLRRSAYASTTSLALASALHRSYGGEEPVVLRNTFPLSTPPEIRRPRERISLAWFSQTIGPGRGLERFLAAWSRTRRSSTLVLIGDGDPRYHETLRQGVPLALRDYLRFEPAVPSRALPAVLRQHDLGLAVELTDPPSRDLTITNKVFQYMEAGLGLIATPTTGQREVLAEAPAAGIMNDFRDPVAAAAELDALLERPARIAAMKAAARAAAERVFCWEREAPRLLASVARALATPARTPTAGVDRS